MTTLSTFMGGAAARALPDAVVEKTKFMILDTLAAMISGSELPPGKFAIQFAKAYGGNPVATVAGSSVRCGPIEAALANGILAHSDETDDTHPPSQSHPGCAAIPATLAVGEKFGIDGTRFLRSVALGYDVGTRITATLGKLQYMFESHRSTHGIAGNFVAAAAAGCAAGLNTQQMRWLLSYASQQASGLASWQRDIDHIEKAFDFGGMAARNGVTGGAARPGGWNRSRRHPVRHRQFLPGICPEEQPRDGRRSARNTVRDHADRHQEVDGRRADSGTARRALIRSSSASGSTRRRSSRSSSASQPTNRPSSTTGRFPTSTCSTSSR